MHHFNGETIHTKSSKLDGMTDPLSSAALDAATQGAQGVIAKLLGPTAEIMGDQLSRAYRESRLFNVFERAESKVDTKTDGVIPPRVVQEIIDEAQWANNAILAEYFSGVLASSRTLDGTDDSGVAWAALLGRLSSDQLALHWLIYTGIQRRSRAMHLESFWELTKNPVVTPTLKLFAALGWDGPIQSKFSRLFAALYGLQRESLLGNLSHGGGSYLRDEVSYTRGRQYDPDTPYITLAPTHAGGSLLLLALGRPGAFVHDFLDEESSNLIDDTEDMPTLDRLALRSDFPLI